MGNSVGGEGTASTDDHSTQEAMQVSGLAGRHNRNLQELIST